MCAAKKDEALLALTRPGSDKIRAWMAADEDGGALGLGGPVGEEQISLHGGKHGGYSSIFDAEGQRRVGLGLRENGDILALDLWGPSGTKRAALGLVDDSPILCFWSAAGQPRVGLGEKGPSLDLYDEAGKPQTTVSGPRGLFRYVP